MRTPSQTVHAIQGAPAHPLCGDLEPFICWVCGGAAARGALRTKWQGANFTGQNRVRCQESAHVCEACVVVMAGRPPNTERFWTHLVDGDSHVRVNKGSKPTIRDFLRRRKTGMWFAAIADSGQKHIIPWAPLNAPHQTGGVVLFEEAIVTLPRDDAGWRLLDELAELLTDGTTKEELSSGDYGPRAWQLLGARLRAFEAAFGELRGGAWFELAVWLAQRDEEQVQARLDAEKKAKEAKRESERRAKRDATKPHRRAAPRSPRRVPADAGVQRPQALDDAPGPDAIGRADVREPRGVGHHDDPHAAAPRGDGEQLALLP